MRVFRTTFLLVALTLMLMMVGQYFGGRNGMTVGLGFAIVGNAFAYFFSDKTALWSSGAQPVSREQLPRLYAVMERLAAKSNIPVPKLYVVPEAAPNAFATGRNPRHASVAVTEGLLQLMNDDELEGVIAHELSHVRNYDILISSIAATLAGAILWTTRLGGWFGYGGRDGDRDRGGSGILGLLLFFLAPFAAMLLQLMDGRAYTATELAHVAGVTPQTASMHLRRLVEGDLLVALAQGRHRYHRLASSEVAEMLEGILRVADRTPSCTAAAARSMPALREARSCYRHLAGVHAVAITDRLLQVGHVLPCEGHWRISAEGAAFLGGLGQPLRELLRQPVVAKPARYCRGCLDCTERRPHLAGLVGEAMLDSFVNNEIGRASCRERV